MTAEVAILRAYAFATQGKYAEAEQLLVSAPETLNTPSGTDLFARIKFEQGDVATARRIWEELLVIDATNESAKNALAAIDAPLDVSEIDEPAPCFCRRRKYVCATVLAVLIGFAFSLGKAWQGRVTPSKNESTICAETEPQSRIIAEQTLDVSKINGKVLSQLRDGILTNMTEKTMFVLSGGRGKYITDRQNCLSVIAENVCSNAKVPLSKIIFKASEKDDGIVKIAVVRGIDNDN
jgi:hypothetical protein